MSLYGGIKFAVGPVENAEAGPSRSPSRSGADNSPGPSIRGSDSSVSLQSTTTEKAKVSRPSAALSFAPRINKAKPTAKPSGPTTSYAAPPVSTFTKPTPVSQSSKDETQYGEDGKALARAPAMTLQVKLVEARRDGNDNSKKRKKKKKKNIRVLPTFDPEEQYDPYRPNDLGEYQEYRKRVKEERRAKYIESRRRKMNGENSESSGYSDSEEEAPRRDAPKMFAPPRMYSPPAAGSGPTLYPPPPSVSAPATGDDAYARRLALSQASTGDDAYARRAALSQGGATANNPAVPSFAPSSAVASIPPPPAFAPPAPPPPSPPRQPTISVPTSFAPPSTIGFSNIPGFTQTPIAPRPFVPPPANLVAAAPGLARPPMPPFAPSLIPQSNPTAAIPAQPTAEQIEFERQLEQKRKALAAIAAKFATLPGAKAPVEPFEEIEGESFAEKMMRKWGHKEGQGLGTKGEGITEALSVEHVEATPKNPATMSKRQLAKQKAAAANAKNRKWVQHSKAHGKIVNAHEEVRQKGELEKYGEPSRVVCLRGIVDDVDDIDEDLADEIGEECSKHGIVERVVLHMLEPPPIESEECLRVFVVFSGMAGAWRNLRELDGRFFGGKKIRATYFDETKFDGGDRDGPIS